MNADNKTKLLQLLRQYKELEISNQIDYGKFYLYSIITHSTAIEGSTVTEVEAQLLFDEGITAKGKPMVEQLMNLDLKNAYEYGIKWIKRHEDITVDSLIVLASKVMARTGSEYIFRSRPAPLSPYGKISLSLIPMRSRHKPDIESTVQREL